MRRTVRLALLAVIAAGLAPGTWLRGPGLVEDLRPILRMEPLAGASRQAGEIMIEGVWHLTSPNSHFHGYSGLVALPDGTLLAVSDRGRWLRFTPPGRNGPDPQFGVIGGEAISDKRQVDAEAATIDLPTGRLWIAYEGANSVDRHDLSLRDPERILPEGMQSWLGNRGPEAMARLADGRFIILGEGSPEWAGEGYPALLFEGDPVDGAESVSFAFVPPKPYRATDMAALPDGRVLILLRAIEGVIPPRFSARLLIADPAAIRAGGQWRGVEVARFGLDLPTDNFEGLAVEPRADGALTLWLISDDNGAALQRTLLYRLRWTPDTRPADTQKARPASPARLSE
ncbi:esterase-like activity of phytase family protein [Altererythrobacter sp. H2]|uniref:esterase-like activity of phytase family protein n=1 Tax=Altererythrobacter sp. H2 TaxID=3108391 RepID=UPI002B4BDD84|nr:esterase-like activity of phytase family protein [Altererythrobacter sp. H2]WRK96109.1 esterase-like activity of phytase family protein [Altererythrobacter sp. H2]